MIGDARMATTIHPSTDIARHGKWVTTDRMADLSGPNFMTPIVDCEAFDDFDAVQDYFGANAEEQPTIDPDLDGLACEVLFGV